MTHPIWAKCPHCGEMHDRSGRYTSPANRERDARWWKEAHLSGKCSLIIFASKTGGDLNHDQTPWVSKITGNRYSIHGAGKYGDRYGEEFIRQPRPEFDHIQTHEPNPLMKDVRAFLRGRRGTDFQKECLSLLEAMDDLVHDNPAHVTHVRRVLTRLAALASGPDLT